MIKKINDDLLNKYEALTLTTEQLSTVNSRLNGAVTKQETTFEALASFTHDFYGKFTAMSQSRNHLEEKFSKLSDKHSLLESELSTVKGSN